MQLTRLSTVRWCHRHNHLSSSPISFTDTRFISIPSRHPGSYFLHWKGEWALQLIRSWPIVLVFEDATYAVVYCITKMRATTCERVLWERTMHCCCKWHARRSASLPPRSAGSVAPLLFLFSTITRDPTPVTARPCPPPRNPYPLRFTI